MYVVTLRNEGSREGIGFTAKARACVANAPPRPPLTHALQIEQDPDSALKSVSGSDYKMQDVLSAGQLTSTSRTSGGATIYDYLVEGPTCAAISVLTATDGRLFAVFVTAPAATWATQKSTLLAMRDSFRTYSV